MAPFTHDAWIWGHLVCRSRWMGKSTAAKDAPLPAWMGDTA